MAIFRKPTAVNAALYVLNRLGETDMHKLFKILYFADREHLSTYGRPITGDDYIAMNFGPVPSAMYDAIKAAQGKSLFVSAILEAKDLFVPVGKYNVRPNRHADINQLSATDIECLEHAIELCRDKDFDALVDASHKYAWHHTKPDTEMSVADIMKEAGCTDEQIAYVLAEQQVATELSHAVA